MARLAARPVAAPLWPRLVVCGLAGILLLALSPLVSPLLPAPHWRPDWAAPDGLWAAAQGVLAARWAEALLIPALGLNALFVLRLRRAA